MQVANKRLKDYAARKARFRRLRSVGVDTARLLRTGGRALASGESFMGVSDSVLHRQRVVAGAMAAPGEGAGDQNLYLAPTLADGGATGRVDPAYDAHMLPIGEWALAVWESWTTHVSMQRMVEHSVRKLTGAKGPWLRCHGPGATLFLLAGNSSGP